MFNFVVMISVNELSVQFGERVLFDRVSFLVTKTDCIGLTGKNGAGKSTMLKILAGLQRPDEGSVNRPKDFKIGYLPQEMEHNMEAFVRAEAATAFKEVNEIESELENINHALSTRTDYESEAYSELLNRLNTLNERMQMLDGYQVGESIERVLTGLGFEQRDFDRKMAEFSGGWRMRVELAKVLLQQPDLLLLDEPTNHLDIESIQWLEHFLKTYSGAVILISHDRFFLDAITNRTLEISLGKVYDYKCNYSKYEVLRAEEHERQKDAAKQQKKYVEHTQVLIDKFRAKKNKAAFAQTLISKLNRLEKIEVDETDRSRMRVNFPPSPRSGKVVVQTEKLGKAYGDHEVLKDLQFIIGRGERVAFIGKNGVGKTTLSKIIVGVEQATGKMELGHNVTIGYYAQNQAELLHGDMTVLATLEQEVTSAIKVNVRSLLGAFLFSGDDVDKKVKVLSGGEKARLAFARLLLSPCNLLVLDEPTNHLDMRSKEVLKEALLQYEGSLILVSHDRDFLDGLTNRIYEFKKGEVRYHHGGIREFLESRKLRSMTELEKSDAVAEKRNEKETTPPKENYKARKQREKDLRKMQNRIRKLEQEIDELEAKLKTVEENLTDAGATPEEIKKHYDVYNEVEVRLQQAMKNWEEANKALEAGGN